MSSDPPRFASPSDLPAPAGYSHVVALPPASRLVWTSGQLPIAADGTVPADPAAQALLVFEHVGRALAAGGADWTNVVKLTFFLVDLADLATVRAARDRFIDPGRPPTSSLVQVAGLVRPEARLEVEAVACVPG